jgi:hypothetical protein
MPSTCGQHSFCRAPGAGQLRLESADPRSPFQSCMALLSRRSETAPAVWGVEFRLGISDDPLLPLNSPVSHPRNIPVLVSPLCPNRYRASVVNLLVRVADNTRGSSAAHIIGACARSYVYFFGSGIWWLEEEIFSNGFGWSTSRCRTSASRFGRQDGSGTWSQSSAMPC